jgi:predicted transposase YdaD
MLDMHDIRETRVYQDAVEEGIEKERQRLLKESIPKMAALKMPASAIADILGVDVDLVQKELEKNHS